MPAPGDYHRVANAYNEGYYKEIKNDDLQAQNNAFGKTQSTPRENGASSRVFSSLKSLWGKA